MGDFHWFKGGVSWVVFLIALGLLLSPSWCQVLEQPPVEYHNLPFPAESPVRAGESVKLSVDRCAKLTSAMSVVGNRVIHNVATSDRYNIPTSTAIIPPGCVKETVSSVVVPREVPPGTYRLIGAITVQGRFREFNIPWSSQEFEVIR